MGKSTAFNRMLGAPAAMMLAAAVTTAVSTAAPLSAPAQANLPTLSWMLNAGAAGASANAGGARAFFAHQAASQIRELDRVFCAAPHGYSKLMFAPLQSAPIAVVFSAQTRPALNTAASSHQHAAP